MIPKRSSYMHDKRSLECILPHGENHAFSDEHVNLEALPISTMEIGPATNENNENRTSSPSSSSLLSLEYTAATLQEPIDIMSNAMWENPSSKKKRGAIALPENHACFESCFRIDGMDLLRLDYDPNSSSSISTKHCKGGDDHSSDDISTDTGVDSILIHKRRFGTASATVAARRSQVA